LQVSGFSDEQLGTRIAERLNATIVLRATRYGKREVVVNFTERREMVQLVLRLKGYLIESHDVRVSRTLEEILEDSYRGEGSDK
jgi:hypothetical protein